MIEFIAFDLGNLLFRVDHAQAWAETIEQTDLEESELYRRFYSSGDMIDNMIGRLDDDLFFSRLSNALEFRGGGLVLRRIWEQSFQPIPERLALLEGLRERVRIGVLSNISRFHSEFIERSCPEMDLFERPVYSWRTGYMKPREEAYAAAREVAGCPADRCLFVDDQERHVQAAREQGWQAITVSLDDDLASAIHAALNVGETVESLPHSVE